MKRLICIGVPFLVGVFLFNFMILKASQSTDLTKFLLKDVEVRAADESAWKNKKLKKIDCTCQVGKKEVKGFTLLCRENGELEKCTAIQQGSNACYDISVWHQELKIICEGAFKISE